MESIHGNEDDSCSILSDSSLETESPKSPLMNAKFVSSSGILKYSYGGLQEATSNFTTLIGHGAFGSVYEAQVSNSETVAVKVLASDSKKGEKEFQLEVMLLGRLHHRNIVNLIGYCLENKQQMLVYVYMSKGSLASHLYNKEFEPLPWELRVQIALDVARGLEYLHDGAVPPVIHRDITSSNILLDESMKARVADFGLSREEMDSKRMSSVRQSGYLDPDYNATISFTKQNDIYSFAVLMFELVAGRSPSQGLMEQVKVAAMNSEEKERWKEIVDPRLNGKYDIEEVNDVANLAQICVNHLARRRPYMSHIVLQLSRIINSRHSRKRQKDSSTPRGDEGIIDMDILGRQGHEHRQVESVDSITADSIDV